MQQTEPILLNPRKKMHKRQFDIADDGVLIYMDPLVGRLENKKRRLVIKVHREANQIELLAKDHVA